MFRPNNADQEREEEKLFVQNALRRRFKGDQQLLFQDFPAFMEHPALGALLDRYKELQDAVHEAFLMAGFGTPPPSEPEIALEAADPDLDIVLVDEEEVGTAEDQPVGIAVVEEVVITESPLIEAPQEEVGTTENQPIGPEGSHEDLVTTADPLATEEITEDPVVTKDILLDHIESHTIDASPIDASPIDVRPEVDPELQLSADPVEETPIDAPEGDGDEPPVDALDAEGADANEPPIDGLDAEGSAQTGDPVEPKEEIPAPMEEKAPVDPPVLPVKLNLPNGKTGVEYIQKIDITPLHRKVESISSYDSTGFEEIGLTFTVNHELTISGSPSDHGKFAVTILLRFEADGDRPAQDYRLQGEIDVLPDPRKMWKEIEPDSTLPYPKSHLRSDLLHLAGRTMIAASRRGRSHAHSGTFRDDEFELAVNEPQSWYIMAVADGAGSAPYSRRGSQIAVERAVEVLQTKLDEKLGADLEALAGAWTRNPTEQLRGQIRSRIYEALSHAAYAGYKSICEEAESISEAPKAFHTTLLLTIIRQFDFGCFVGTWWVGDGAVGVMRQGKYLKVLGTPDGGQFAGQTRFLTMPEIWADGATVMKRIEFDVVVEPTAVILMTDGVSDPKFHTDHNLLQQENWDKLWDELNETVSFDHDNLDAPEQLLEWLDFWAAGEHDDRTIAIFF